MRYPSAFLSLVGLASVTALVGNGCSSTGGSSGSGGTVGSGGAGVVAGRSGTGGSTSSGGVGPASGGAAGCGRCDASVDDATTGGSGGAGGRSGAGGGVGGLGADVALDMGSGGALGGTGGLGSGGDGIGRGGVIGTDGDVRDGRGGAAGSTDGGVDGPECIKLGDIPSAQLQAADPSQQIQWLTLLGGPCDLRFSSMGVEFHYWEHGYSCPRLGDKVTCEVEVTSRAGSTAIVIVTFVYSGSAAMVLTWHPEPTSTIAVTFPPLDGGSAGQ
jgi:hypothetical protein